MNKTCHKCGSGTEEEGALYKWQSDEPIYLCHFCHTIFNDLYENLFETFMQENAHDHVLLKVWLSTIQYHMLRGRMERKNGKGPWNK